MSRRAVNALITIAVLAITWFIPAPAGLKVQAWHLFAIFLATVVGFILQPVANGTIALMSLMLAVLTKTLTLAQVLSSFGNTTVWLVVSAFLFAKGFIKTGLGRRIAYLIMRSFGDSTLKLAYSLAISDVIIGPATPSNTARAGGVFFPIVESLCAAFDSHPGPSAKRIGAYLMSAVFHIDIVVSAMFLTSMAANPLASELARKTLGVDITWGTWFIAAVVPGILGLLVVPWLLLKLCPPELTKTPEAKRMAAQELAKMGPMSGAEKVMLTVFLAALVLWATASFTKLDGTTVALVGVCVMVASDVLTWKDVITESKAWDTLVWMGAVVGLAGFLNTTGFIKWFAALVAHGLVGTTWVVALVAAFLIYLYSHYGFASMTAHVTAMYAALIAVAAAAGAPVFLAAFAIAIAANLCGCLTHFGTGPAPIYFGAGYVDQATWWRNGFLLSLVHSVIWLGVGGVWWKVLGLW